jgi:hypothetical protein
MAWTVDEALDHKLVTVVDRDDKVGHYAIRIGDLKTVITIDLKPSRTIKGWTEFKQSHAMKAPGQNAPYWTSRPMNNDPGSALHQAIRGLADYYEHAIQKGHQPEEAWLVARKR